MNNSATQMLVSATIEFLQAYPPFDRMEPDALQFLAGHIKLAYYPKDSEIISTATGVARRLYILQRGKVMARQAGDISMFEYSSMTLGPGECFPIGSVMAQRPSTNTYTALEDVFCYEFFGDFPARL